MINAIGETPEFIKSTWENTADYHRDEFKRKMALWAEKYPLTAIMITNIPIEEKVKYAEMRFG